MTITVNGVSKQLNLGCHSYLSVSKLLLLLGIATDSTLAVQINKQLVTYHDYAERLVKSSDRIQITT